MEEGMFIRTQEINLLMKNDHLFFLKMGNFKIFKIL